MEDFKHNVNEKLEDSISGNRDTEVVLKLCVIVHLWHSTGAAKPVQ